MTSDFTLPQSTALSTSGLMHLKRFWSKVMLRRVNKFDDELWKKEWQLDKTLLSVLGLGIEQTLTYVFQYAPAFEEFEKWIVHTSGSPTSEQISRFNSLFNEAPGLSQPIPSVLSAEELVFWTENGYLILKNVIPKEDCQATIDVICDFLKINLDDANTWYSPNTSRQGIMVQLFQHPLLQKNRQSARIRMAYEQLWQRTDIWVTTDRVGFNPPETDKWKFTGPDLHWDCSLDLPIPFNLQGLLYLADTAPNQGAFTLVPGFQHRISEWLRALPAGTNPRTENLHALGSLPIAAEAGDFIIWHQALPHGSSPNASSKPRFVQYINYQPADFTAQKNWM
ncbi:phytanoyl-CoA dioxygenase family protein [Pedobacter sp. MR2016-19]|uniref:phytanoyl-CoA dioxygenase family protein n=1 Tax=Pedobacter sp. MR2016-19 TaxID=2780089 RepID=UPI001875112D|nr:phytanoyl-CoA dioxygenase family protein [Pedobacter sp. MR2016-19]MBE5321619.1 phytanoyl-CoA dioxygenase family protein [Pedobacter sp. MR2016-19]